MKAEKNLEVTYQTILKLIGIMFANIHELFNIKLSSGTSTLDRLVYCYYLI